MVTVEITPEYAHAIGVDYFTKNNTTRLDKVIYFDVTFAANENYQSGIDIDLSKWFTRIIGSKVVDRGLIGLQHYPYTRNGAVVGTVHFRDTRLGGGTNIGAQDAPNNAGEIKGKKIRIRVHGY